ncbi:MAG: RluA family pseudouridine synthase [Muribaculaceae bacterium]|nr:RluA family pseudouridine synthase [Muribaculaceae bacterium]
MNSKKSPRRGPATDNVAKFTIKEDGTLLAAAAALLPDHKPTKLKSMLRHNQLAINGVPSTQFDQPVSAGDQLWVNFDRSFQVFSHPRIKLVFEDNDIIVVDKGYGVLSTAAGKPSDDTVFNIVKKYARGFSDKANVYVVHRLDRDTSGLMLLTRTKQARDKLISNWNNMVIERKYIAIVEGKVEQKEGTVKSFLAENPDTFEMYSTEDKKLGRLAVTRYRVVKQGRRYAMVELEIKTGRKNQIRVHMHDLGNPVSGDRKYGGHPSPINRIALHATTLSIVHPITGKAVTFTSPAPENFNTMID